MATAEYAQARLQGMAEQCAAGFDPVVTSLDIADVLECAEIVHYSNGRAVWQAISEIAERDEAERGLRLALAIMGDD